MNKSLVMRACQLSESFQKNKMKVSISIFPETINQYERCKSSWDSLIEEDLPCGTAKILHYKDVTIFKPRE
jgi:hypothetical protein